MIETLKFQCWNCPRVYSQEVEITKQQELIVSCPFCGAEAVVDFRPYDGRILDVLRGKNKDQHAGKDSLLPDSLPTQKKPN